MTSSSRTEPPGWMTATAPAATAASSPSRNGKKASDAQAVPLRPLAGPASGQLGRLDAAHLPGPHADRDAGPWRARSRSTSRAWRRPRRSAGRATALRWAGPSSRPWRPRQSSGGSDDWSRNPPATLRRSNVGDVHRVGSQDPQVLLLRQDLESIVVVSRGDDDLGEDLGDRLSGREVAGRVQSDDPAERRCPVAIESLRGTPREMRRCDRDSARVRVLDDRGTGSLELERELPRCVGVEEVVVRQLLAVELLGRSQPRGSPGLR